MRMWFYSSGSGYDSLVGSCDLGNKNAGSINYRNFRQVNEYLSLTHIVCLVNIRTY